MVNLVRDLEYIELPIKCLRHSAVVRTDGSYLKPSGDNVVGNIVFQHSRRAFKGFRKVGTLRAAIAVLNDCDTGSIFGDYQKHQSLQFSFDSLLR